MGKKLILLLCFFACAASCSTKRTISSTHEENATHAKTDIKIDEIQNQFGRYVFDTNIKERIGSIKTIEFRIYDTEKEPDSLGNRPLLAEGKITEETENEKVISEVDSISFVFSDSTTVKTENIIEIKNEKDGINYTKRDLPTWYYFVMFFGVVAFAIFFIKIYDRK